MSLVGANLDTGQVDDGVARERGGNTTERRSDGALIGCLPKRPARVQAGAG